MVFLLSILLIPSFTDHLNSLYTNSRLLWLKQAAACKVQQVLLKEIMDVSQVLLLKKGQKISIETVYVVSLFIY